MPERDNISESAYGRRITRRVVLAGSASLGLAASAGLARAMAPPLRIGVVDTLELDVAAIDRACRARWGCRATLVPLSSWAALRDHASAPAGGLIDGAVLPAEDEADGVSVALPHPVVAATLIGRGSLRGPIGVALRHPLSDAALRAMLPWTRGERLIELPPAALAPNVAAGLLGGAVVTGRALIETAFRLGLAVRAVDPVISRDLVPPLALARRLGPEPRRAGA